jgi:hypothetical protein
VDLVDEEHLPGLEVGEDRREIAGLLEHRTGRRSHGDAELVRDHVRERRLAEAGRAVQQHVIERLAALPRGSDRHVEVLANVVLPDVLVERAGPEPCLVLTLLVGAAGAHESIRVRGHRRAVVGLHRVAVIGTTGGGPA